MDGAPALSAENRDLLKQDTEVSVTASFHYVIYIENIYILLSEADTLERVMDRVLSIVRQICAKGLNHHQFMELLKNPQACRLSPGRVLRKFTPTLSPIKDFLKTKGMFATCWLSKEEGQCDVRFLTNITLYMDELNLKLESFLSKLTCDLARWVGEFICNWNF